MVGIRRIAHVAVLVQSVDRAAAFWQRALGLPLDRIDEVPTEDSRVAFLPLGDSEIELVQPTAMHSGLARYLEKHGSGLHHICLEVDDLAGALTVLRQGGVRLINDVPVQGSAGRRYAFIHPKAADGVLIELYEARC